MIGSPNFKLGPYDGGGSTYSHPGPVGSGQVQSLFDDFFHAAGWNTSAAEFDGRSDYAPFIDNGIAGGGTFTGAEELKTAEEALMFGGKAGEPFDPNYHLEKDDLPNVSKTAFLLNSRAIAHAIAWYGEPSRISRSEVPASLSREQLMRPWCLEAYVVVATAITEEWSRIDSKECAEV